MTDRTEVFRGQDRQWRWRRIAANNQIIATSGESFASRRNAERAAHRAFPSGSLPSTVSDLEGDDPDWFSGPQEPPHPAIEVRVAVVLIVAAVAFMLGVFVGWAVSRVAG